MTLEQERAAFEAAMREIHGDRGLTQFTPERGYGTRVHEWWVAWQAGRAALAAAPQVPAVPDERERLRSAQATEVMPLISPLPEPAWRERVYAGHGNEEVCEWYTAEQMREREAAVIAACAKRCDEQAARWSDDRAVYVAHECARALLAIELRTLLATQPAPQVPAVPQRDDADRLLREVFALCEATEDAPEVEAKNEHQRGFDRVRRFEAKQIRRAIGAWFQDEFCGRSFMGEPAAPAAPQVPVNSVPMPTNADQAAAMALIGEAWLRENAPERLRTPQPAASQVPAVPALLNSQIKPRPLTYSLDDYHRAPGDGPLHFQWTDKPHRLLYDLIAAVRYYATPQPAEQAPLTDARIEFGLINQLGDPGDDEAQAFYEGVRYAEHAHGIRAAGVKEPPNADITGPSGSSA